MSLLGVDSAAGSDDESEAGSGVGSDVEVGSEVAGVPSVEEVVDSGTAVESELDSVEEVEEAVSLGIVLSPDDPPVSEDDWSLVLELEEESDEEDDEAPHSPKVALTDPLLTRKQ